MFSNLQRRAFTLAVVMALIGVPVVSERAVGQCEGWAGGAGTAAPPLNSINDLWAATAMTVWDPDGPGPQQDVLVVGVGSALNGNMAPVGPVLTWDGTQWGRLCEQSPCDGTSPPYPTNSADVASFAVYQGQLIAAGTFRRATPWSVRIGVARWTVSGWQLLGGATINGAKSLTVHNGELYVGGSFTQVGTQAISGVARWDGTAWSGINSPSTQVTKLAEYNGSLLVVQPGSMRTWDGSQWTAIPNFWGGSGLGQAVLVVGNDIYCDTENVVLRKWDGSSWQEIYPEETSNCWGSSRYRALTIFQGQIVTGTERLVDDHTEPLGGMCYAGSVLCSAEYHGRLFVGAWFYNWSPVRALGIAAFDGTTWRPVADQGGFNGAVRAAVEYQGSLVVGGDFGAFGGTVVRGVAARELGGGWSAIGEGASHSVRALAADSTHLYAAEYDAFGASPSYNSLTVVRAWDGSVWNPMGAALSGVVNSMAVYNGQPAVGGNMTSSGPAALSRIAVWDGASWGSLGTGLNGDVNALLADGGNLYAGGSFTRAGAVDAAHVARWDGQQWLPLGDGQGDPVRALTRWGDQIVAATSSYYAPVPSSVMGWDGTEWRPVGPVLSGTATSLSVSNGDLVVGGYLGSQFQWARLRAGAWELHPLSTSRITGGTSSISGEVDVLLGHNDSVIVGGVVDSPATYSGCSTLVQQRSPYLLEWSPTAAPSWACFSHAGMGANWCNDRAFTAQTDCPHAQFQWRRNRVALEDGVLEWGTMVVGAHARVMHLLRPSTPDSGSYDVVVSTSAGQIVSPARDFIHDASSCGDFGCGTIDFNRDGVFPDLQDLADFIDVFAGGECCNPYCCAGLDFNRDGVSPDTEDLRLFMEYWATGTCPN